MSDAFVIPFSLRVREVVVIKYLYETYGASAVPYVQYCKEIGQAIIQAAVEYRIATGNTSGTIPEVTLTMDAGDLWQQLAARGADTDNKVFAQLAPSDMKATSAVYEQWAQTYATQDFVLVGATFGLVGNKILQALFQRPDITNAYKVLTQSIRK